MRDRGRSKDECGGDDDERLSCKEAGGRGRDVERKLRVKGKKGGKGKRERRWKCRERRCEGGKEREGKGKGMRRQKGDRWLRLSGLLPLRRRRRGRRAPL